MADISKITVLDGTQYDIKDASAISNITRSGTTFTATRRNGTSFTFTQQDNNTTYSAATQSAAGLMSAADKTKLDGIASGATSTSGTVTSVAASGSDGISISGSPITTSGTIGVGLDLSTAINGLSIGTSAANRNDYAVVQYVGGGTTTTTYHRRTLANVFKALNSSDITTALGYTPYNSTNPNGYTTNTGTVTSVSSGVGLTGSVTTTGSIKAKLRSETALTNDSAAATETSGRVYPVAVDKSGYLAVNVPWQNTAQNQNAFSNFKVGSTTIAADTTTDTMEFTAGSNITLTPDATNDKLTIAATNTTYGAGTGLSLSGTTFNHSNSVTAGTAGTSSATSGSTLAVPYVTYDAQGHITGSGTHTHTVNGFLTSSSSLDASKLTGTVPTSVLPSYVDDVLEYTAKSNFPSTGEAGKIYVDTATNLTYRWGGSAYVEISPSLAIGTTASTAAKGNHTHSVTATGTVSQPTFTGTAATISVSKSYTPAGSVAAPTFTGTKASGLTVSPASSGTTTYTPAGTVSQPTFSGTQATISVSKSYTPAGSVSTPTISVKTAGSTTTVNSITAVGTLPSLTVTNQTVVTGTSVSNEVLSFTTATNGSASGWSAGTLPTKGSNTTVKTGDAAYESSQPSFTGTAATITSTGTYTPAGTVSQPTFTGTGKRLVLQDYTPAGTNSAPAFTGTAATITSTGSYTPAGTVSTPTFTGSAVTTGTPA